MSEDPYAPPIARSDVPSAPPSHGWRFENEELIAGNGAQLPMVDPYNGRSSERMFLHPLIIRSNSLLIRIFSASFAIIFLLSMILRMIWEWVPGLFPSLMMIHIVILLGLLLFSKQLRISMFLTSETSDKIHKERIFTLVTTSLMVLSGILSGMRGKSIPEAFHVICVAAFWTLLLLRFIKSFVGRRPSCRRISATEYAVLKFHPDAITYLKRSSSAQTR